MFSRSGLIGLNIPDSLQNKLFNSLDFTNGKQIDLAATNINRAREHGIPSYNKYREFCGLGLASSFNDLANTMGASSIASLQSVYNNVNDIDLWVGGLAEGVFIDGNRVNDTFRPGGSVVGATFKCLMEKQFIELKKGDRFFYENQSPTGFTISIYFC